MSGPGGSMNWVVGLPNNSYRPINDTAWVRARLCKLHKGCTRLAAASDQVYQLLAHGRWFSPGTPASSTTKTGRHDIAESGVKHQKYNQIKSIFKMFIYHKLFNVLFVFVFALFLMFVFVNLFLVSVVRRPSVNFFKNLLLWNHWANLNQTWPESSLGGFL